MDRFIHIRIYKYIYTYLCINVYMYYTTLYLHTFMTHFIYMCDMIYTDSTFLWSCECVRACVLASVRA